MANLIKIKRSGVQSKIPLTTDLVLGELALNTYDGKLYTKKNDGADSVVQIGNPALLNATNDTSTSTLYPVFVGAAGSDQTPKVTTSKLFFNASTGVLSTSSIAATTTDLTLSAISTGAVKFNTLGGTQVQISDSTVTGQYTSFSRNVLQNIQNVGAMGTANLGLYATGGGVIRFFTASDLTKEQFRIADTTSAVNYVQVTGSATTLWPILLSQGSDTNVGMQISSKGTGSIRFNNNSNANQVFRVDGTVTASVNYLQVAGANTTATPVLSAQGTDTNIDLALTPKGTGQVKATNTTNSILQSIGSSGYGSFLANSSTGNSAYYFGYINNAEVSRITMNSSNSIEFGTGNTTATQFNIANTASAVNYVQVTGGATNNRPTASSQGSDTDIGFNIVTKGSGTHNFASDANIGTSQFQVTRTQASAVNYLTATGSATGFAPRLFAAGTDTNISMAFQPKGTGAINLAAGSSGVNISNGGTVTAITRTNSGSGYTTIPSIAITAPTTAGGVQATASVAQMQIAGATIAGGGTGYTVGNTLTIVGGTPVSGAATLTVTTVSAGVITGVSIAAFNNYTALPTNPVSVTGGSGSGATFNLTWAVISFTITNAGSGYIEQPTVSFSGGGGSGAAAYATVGSGTIVRSLGSTISFHTPNGETFRASDNNATAVNYWAFSAGTASANPLISVGGSGINVSQTFNTKGTGVYQFSTGSALQYQISHTASAVNYLNVTGGAASSPPVISVLGSDTNINLGFTAKGTGLFLFNSNGGEQFRIQNIANAVNNIQVYGQVSGQSPTLIARGTDTNVGLILASKGTGSIALSTGVSTATQLSISDTASAVNYVQITGAVTGANPSITVQGSDAARSLNIGSKGTTFVILSNNGTVPHFSAGGTGSAVNYLNARGNATGNGAALETTGTDTNIAMQLISKGTGAIDLAAGSSGVNISNGGTVTNITRTNQGSGYTTLTGLTWTASAPTTASGVTATGTVTSLGGVSATLASGGTLYTAGDILTVSGGTFSSASTIRVDTVSSGVITAATLTNGGTYTVIPTNPVSVTGGSGSSATFNISYGVLGLSIGTAGSGYVEQPTITFSGGGGSNAAAYATVGGATSIKGLGGTIELQTAQGRGFLVYESGTVPANYWSVRGGAVNANPVLYAQGSDTNVSGAITTKGTGQLSFQTNGAAQTQFVVSHTASAVNYVQVTGGSTGNNGLISTAGSDTNVGMTFQTKAAGSYAFITGGGRQLDILNASSAVNRMTLVGSAAGSAPILSVVGTDTNIDLALTTKGTGSLILTAPALSTPNTSFDLINTNATTVNFAQVATALTMSATTGTTTIRNNLSIGGNLTVGGTTTTVNAVNLSITDNMIYLNADRPATITNAVGNGTTVTYTAVNTYTAGDSIRVTGMSPSGYNIAFADNKTVLSATSTQFVVTKSDTGTYVSGGSAFARSQANPDLGFAGGYYDGTTYAHAGLFRDATDTYFKVFKNYTPEPDASAFIDTAHASFALADIQAANFRGALIGNADTVTNGVVTSGSYANPSWITSLANTKITGLGTMSTQDASSVAITGGSINGTTIGATTASTGKFSDLTDTGLTSGRVTYATTGGNLTDSANLTFDGTTLTANAIQNTPIGSTTASTGAFTTLQTTGQVDFNSSSATSTFLTRLNTNGQTSGYCEYAVTDGTRFGELGLVVSTSNSYGAVNEVYFRGSGQTSATVISSASATTPQIKFITGASGSSTEQVRIANTASAVNYVQLTGAVASSGPIISAQGSDTNIDVNINSKGTGAVNLATSGGVSFKATRAFVTGTAVNYIDASGRQTGLGPVLSTNGSDTNVRFNITSKGNEAIGLYTNLANQLQFNVTHTDSSVNYFQVTGAVTGGNPTLSAQGSDADVGITLNTKGNGLVRLQTSAITRFSIDNTGSTTKLGLSASGGVGFQVTATGSQVNFYSTGGTVTGLTPTLTAGNSADTNVSMALLSKGTGAIDLVAGSNGINVSNGGTVTAITVTATGIGGSYTTIPSVAITAPTTAGGVQATANAQMGVWSLPITNGGTLYSVNDVLTVVGGTFLGGTAQQIRVTAVSSGVITAVTAINFPTYTVLPPSPASVTGGTGSGATFSLTWAVYSVAITAAGSGYIEQPTVSFSGGGGGSGAAAFASVGTVTTIKGIGSAQEKTIQFQGLNGLNILELDGTSTNTTAETLRIQPTQFGRTNVIAVGGTNSQLWLSASGTGFVNFSTRGTSLVTQFRVADTASAVNYLQVAGSAAANTTGPILSAQGTDTNIPIQIQGKGTGSVSVLTPTTLGGTTGNTAELFAAKGFNSNAIWLRASQYRNATGADWQTASLRLGMRIDSTDMSYVEFNPNGFSQGLALQAANTQPINFKTSGGEQFRVAEVASAVNYVQVAGSATTAFPTISVQGSDTNIGLQITSKGTGSILMQPAGVSTLRLDSAAGRTNLFQMYALGTGAGSASGNIVMLGTDTNIDLNLVTKGTGSINLQTGETTTTQVRIVDRAGADNFISLTGGVSGTTRASLGVAISGGGGGSGFNIYNSGGQNIRFQTNGVQTDEQFIVSHTASAVNQVQVTGSAASGRPSVSAVGSDSNINLYLVAKGSGQVQTAGWMQVGVGAANYLQFSSATGGSAPAISALGSDTNIDLTLTPKGTGTVAVTGSIAINGTGDSVAKLYGDSFVGLLIQSARDSASDHAILNMWSSRGTVAAKTALQNGDIVSTISSRGHDGTNYFSTATINTKIDGAVSTNVVPQSITFNTGTGASPGERMSIKANGNVLIGSTTDAGYKLYVNGSFAATTKSFVIEHPTKPKMMLRYGSLEGPENGVYVRGKLSGSNVIELPDYWVKLVDAESITVSLTSIGKHQNLFVKDISDNKVTIGNGNLFNKDINCFYVIYGERCDVEKLKVEIPAVI